MLDVCSMGKLLSPMLESTKQAFVPSIEGICGVPMDSVRKRLKKVENVVKWGKQHKICSHTEVKE